MAYTERYTIGWSSNDCSGYVYIDKLDSIEESEPLTLIKDGITINTGISDYDTNVFSQTAQINILNDKENFFDLLPLLSAEEREYRIRINQTSPTTKYLFEGFINSDIVEQTYLPFTPIRLVASNYIKKLEYVSPSSIQTIQKKSLIDLIDESLLLTGTDSNIRVNMSICPSGHTISTDKTALNLCAVDTELFWKNNAERDSGLDVIEKILKPFDSYIYWWNRDWYIERYDDLDSSPQHFIQYNPSISYVYTSGGTIVTRTDSSKDINSYYPLEQSQQISIIPGLKTLEIKSNDQEYNSLILSDFTNLSSMSQGFFPFERTWRYLNDSNFIFYENSFGKQNGYIVNSCWMDIAEYLIGKPINTHPYDNYKYKDCLMTSFKCTVTPSGNTEGTSLTLKWKWKPNDGNQSFYSSYVKSYSIRWYLKFTNSYYHIHQDSEDNWSVKYSTDNEIGYNVFTITPTELDKNKDYIYEANISIPLSNVSGMTTGDKQFQFGLLLPSYRFESDFPGATGDWFVTGNIWGDVVAAVTSPTQDNFFSNEITTKFLNKKTIDLDIYDVTNLNYKNGLYTGVNYPNRTSVWYDSTSTNYSIVDRLIKNRFKLYNKSRQKIKAKIYCNEHLKPFSIWTDTNQEDKIFLLISYSFTPTIDEYSCVWIEYDNTEIINIINT